MKKLTVLVFSIFLSACSTLGVKQSCLKEELKTVSYFEEGQKLVAFRFAAQAKGYQLDGILQVKKTAQEHFEITAYAVAGGVRLMTAQVSRAGTEFTYVLPLADHAVVRGKVETFLTALLFPPQRVKSCREENGEKAVSVEGGNYRYYTGKMYPYSLTYKKMLGSATLSYDQSAPYEHGQVPHYLQYQDGGVEAELVMISLKK